MIKNTLTVAKREFRSFFDQPTAYILLVVFLAINFFFYFRTVFISGEATLRPMFDLLPWLLLFFVPAVTMRSLAEERARGTLELLQAQPIRGLEVLLGKFLGVMGFLALAVAGTAGAFVALIIGSEPFGGVAFAQYVGAVLLTSGLVAIGLWASALTRNQITAFIVAVTVIFVLIAITLDIVLLGLPGTLAAVATRLGLLTHFDNIARGVIDLRDVVYYVSLTAGFLSLAHLALERDRLNRGGSVYRRLWIGTVGILAICLVVNLLGQHIRGRLDLTPGGAYTLSEPTKKVLRDLDDLVSIRLFASRDLPPQMALVQRDLDDLLSDYAASGPNIEYSRLSPEGKNEDRAEADRLRIPAIQFNVLGQDELQVRQGYLGLAIQYADQLETIPFVQQTADLEYRLTSLIRGMTEPRTTRLGFLTGHGELDIEAQLGPVAERLRQNYEVTAVALADSAPMIPDSIDVLIIGGPTRPLTETAGQAVGEFLSGGGNTLIAITGVGIDENRLFTSSQPHPVLDSLLGLYGVSVPAAVVFDLRSNGNVTQPTASGLSFLVPYPLWPVARAAAAHVIVDQISGVLLPWASPLDLSAAAADRVIPLLATSEAGGILEGSAPIAPQLNWNNMGSDLSRRPLAAAVLPPEESGRGRLVVVGNAAFATERFVQAQPDNLRFFENAVDWLAEEESLISIRAKSRRPPPLLFDSDTTRNSVKYLNLIGLPVLIVLLGVGRLFRRRKLMARPYVRPNVETA
ncbi:MAG: Gldg family protein [Gemmatimonadota bacterium]